MTPHVPPTEHREPLLTIHQPPAEDLRNLIFIAESWALPNLKASPEEISSTFRDLARLARHALTGLSEPSEAAIQMSADCLRSLAANGCLGPDALREARDTAALILTAQLRGSGSRGEPT